LHFYGTTQSMNQNQFISYLSDPSQLDKSSLEELDELIKEYPYFQSARILFSINLLNESNIRYDSELKATAINAGNRVVLKKHIDKALKWKKSDSQEIAQQEITSDQEAVEQPSSDSPQEDSISQLKKIIEQRIREIEEEKRQKGEKEKKKPLSKKTKFSIIDNFIHNDPSISRAKGEFYDPVVKAKQSIVEQQDIVSETLAKIYYDQGYYEKAIEMYEKLILKVPEKSSYFAALIEKAKKELNNK